MNFFGEQYWAINLGAAAGLLAGLQSGNQLIQKDQRQALRMMSSTIQASVGGNRVNGNGGKVGLISMMGTMTRYGDACAYGTEDYLAMVEEVNSNDAYCGAVIRAESFGGSTNGLESLAKAIRTSEKPLVAWVAGASFSANYWMVSQCRETWVESLTSSEIGSIGVYSVKEDWTEHLQKQGKKITIIRAEGCEDKVALNPFEPAPEGAFERERAVATSIYNLFKADVLAARPQANPEALTGHTYQGGKGIEMGLADRQGSLREAINRVAELARL